MTVFQTLIDYFEIYIVDTIDIDYSLWLTWCLAPLLVTFLLPVVIVLLLYITALSIYIYKLHWNNIRETLERGDKWYTIQKFIACIWDAHGWIWHGYEVRGMHNIPKTGPALLIYYHGAIPIDIYYFLPKVLYYHARLPRIIADYFFFKIPGFNLLAECMNIIPGTVQSCSNILKDGNLLAIAPGGVYEAQHSHHYNLMWKKRLGFAKVAIDAKAPVIPMFTENVREAFRTVSIGRRFFLKIYARFKLPLAPIYGGFPVKMITHIGEPIPYDPNLTPEQLQAKVAAAMEDLIKKHQRLPGNILYGLLERIPHLRNKLKGEKQKDDE